jgi:hypothetical protein
VEPPAQRLGRDHATSVHIDLWLEPSSDFAAPNGADQV